jgi:DNA replication protein DnaC
VTNLLQNQSITNLNPYIKGLSKRFENCGFKNFIERDEKDKNAKLLCKKFFEHETEKECLLFLGSVGVGKTHLAVATLRCLKPIVKLDGYLRRATAEILNADEYFMILNDAIAKRESKLDLINKYLNQNDVFCLDDLGTKNFTEAKQENLYALINTAYLNMKRLIITTNFTLDDLAKFDERIASRLCEMSQTIILTGKDFRLTK